VRRVLLSFFLLSSFLLAQVVIVTNKETYLDAISKEKIKYVYLGKVNSIDGIKFTPYILNDKTIHEQFLEKVIEKTNAQYQSYWSRLLFTGRNSFLKTIEVDMISTVLSKPNTLVYMDESQVDTTKHKVVYKVK